MKIAFIGQKGIPATSGGVEKHVDELAKMLSQRGHEVYVYTRPHYTNKFLKKYGGVNLISLPSIETKHLDAITHTFLACLDVIFFRDYDILHFHSIGPSSLLWLVKIFKRKTVIVATFHSRDYEHKKWGDFAKNYLKFSEFMLCKTADKVITVSKSLKEYADRWYKINSVYIPNGVIIPEILPAQYITKTWGLTKGSYFLIVSRLVGHKGIHHAIHAYNKLNTEKKLVIVGTGAHTGGYVEFIKALTSENPNIIMTGEQTGYVLSELFSNAYMFIQPSEAEGLSIALLEAMSYDNPVLVSDIKENMEVVGDNGYSFINKNVDDLADKLSFFLGHSTVLKNDQGENRTIVKKNYNWDDITDKTIEVYKSAFITKAPRRNLSVRKIVSTVS